MALYIILAFVSGDNLAAQVIAPLQEGRYVSYFRLQHGKTDTAFGQRFWCDVRVVKPANPNPGPYHAMPSHSEEAVATMIPQAIAEAISSVINQEEEPHE